MHDRYVMKLTPDNVGDFLSKIKYEQDCVRSAAGGHVSVGVRAFNVPLVSGGETASSL